MQKYENFLTFANMNNIILRFLNEKNKTCIKMCIVGTEIKAPLIGLWAGN